MVDPIKLKVANNGRAFIAAGFAPDNAAGNTGVNAAGCI
jgi:hypothetical protein